VAAPAGFIRTFSSSSHAAHLRLIRGSAAETDSAGSRMRITRSATVSASRSSGSSTAPISSFVCRTPDPGSLDREWAEREASDGRIGIVPKSQIAFFFRPISATGPWSIAP
jgi:hypothetical protein